MQKQVELQHAWEWICDDCGRSNFCSAIKTSLDENDLDGGMDLIVSEDGEHIGYVDECFLTMPEEVVCSHCEASFETEDPGGGDDG